MMQLDELEIRLYLTRIGVEYSFSRCDLPTFERLSQIHRAHLATVPFENLSIVLKEEMKLGGAHAFEKVVGENRGGFCYELNYAFYQLLRALRFDVQLLSAQVYNADTAQYGQPFDHLVLLVNLANKNYLADVGFGDSFIFPVELGGDISYQPSADFKITDENGMKVLSQRKAGGPWCPQYKFSMTTHDIEDFSTMFDYHRFSPESSFTQKSVCTLLTDYGRITLSNGKLIRTEHGEKQEIPIKSADKYLQLLLREFKINLPEKDSVEKLLSLDT